MIGQNNLLNKFRAQIETGIFPRFVILCGMYGGGKEMLANEIGKFLSASVITVLPKVDDIREMISLSYKMNTKTLFIIPNADNMSPAAKNAMLKVAEEPPNNCYYIMTLQDQNNTLPTIRSRAAIYHIDPYSESELSEYCKQRYGNLEEETLILNICETPGEIDLIVSMDVKAFYDFVCKVVDNIAEVSTTNCFNIANNIAFKDTDTNKYDLRLFLKAFMLVCLLKMKNSEEFEDIHKYGIAVRITSSTLQSVKLASINKLSTFDSWILSIRREW